MTDHPTQHPEGGESFIGYGFIICVIAGALFLFGEAQWGRILLMVGVVNMVIGAAKNVTGEKKSPPAE